MQADPDGSRLASVFEAVSPLTIGLEEEVFLVDPDSLELAPVALELLTELEDPRLKPELPAAQVEILTPACASVGEAVAVLAGGREALSAGCAGRALPLAAGVHPFATAEGELNRSPRYDLTLEHYGTIARRQLVCALQVHVAVGGAQRTLAVYNALRGHLPELAALAANAPFYEGRDTGLASVRPKISEALPRQGVPPPIHSWESLADELRWGAGAGTVPEPRMWWWELRPHVAFGTLEIRVPDAQSGIVDVAAVAAVAHCLVASLAARYDDGETLPCAPSWRIAENRWLACRDGVDGTLIDLRSGERRATRAVLGELLDRLEPHALELACVAELGQARALMQDGGATRQREVAGREGLRGLARWLTSCFCEPGSG